MDTAPLFSVVVIARNERQTLPRLLASLDEFRTRGGEVIVMDTGSTDGTQDFAESAGCRVFERTFTQQLGYEEALLLNEQFVERPDKAAFKTGDQYFDFSMARNIAAEHARNDVIAMPDCDEVYTRLDIDKINEAIRRDVHQFEYDFVYAHDAEGKPAVQFMHCKFYDRRKLIWTGVVHEILSKSGPWSHTKEYVDFIKLEHWQNPSTARGQYLTGLAVDVRDNPNNDRNAFYFARELMYSGRNRSAIAAFKRHIELKADFVAERAQSMIHIGDIVQDVDWYFKAWKEAPWRREPLLRIADHYYKKGIKFAQQVVTFTEAALTIPQDNFYGNHAANFTWYPHEMLYWAYWNLGNTTKSGYHWGVARKYAPLNSKFLHDARFYNKLPKVSIVIPHVAGTREESLKNLQQLIKENANYPDYEVIIETDDFVSPQGCPKTFNRGVQRATGELIMFLGDDCEPQANFLIHAVMSHLQFKWDYRAERVLTALNDGVWNGALATHWLADKDFVQLLPTGAFLFEGYSHVGCDNELTAWAKKDSRYNYCSQAKLVHAIMNDEVHWRAWGENQVAQDRALLVKRCEIYELDKKDALCAE